ncbi:zinc-dependent alcohol dehydrogenase [Paenibacillus etheri]|uniref:Alcohol dehydrogenase n=1 Tax=Paenibacillus etheri TaxID=1306852 RepID=A0A0W1B1L9_9BACL|nr:alcohol dehydrogenase catalytic domain-containing protein [Paenibacillus etheri]KTD87478.1 alcohol dehydrogenase [Paenibacillus etheri]
MKALVYTAPKTVELMEMEEPNIQSDTQVKVKIYGSGICGTDLNVIKGKIFANKGTVIGHEGVGTVVEVGKWVRSVSVGDRVIVDPTQACGVCHYCRKSQFCYCENFEDHQVGMTIHGTFAEYYVGEEKYMYKIPNAMSWETAMLIEPLGCVLNTFLKAEIKPSDSVVVLGSGAIGSLCQLISKRLGRLTVGTEPDDYRRNFASNIADYVFDPADMSIESILALNDNRKFDIVVDCVGNQLHTALELIGKGGRIIPMGYNDQYEVSIRPTDFINNGVNIIGKVAVHQIVGMALEFAQSIPELEGLITSKVALEHYEQAFNETMGYHMRTGDPLPMTSVKSILVC